LKILSEVSASSLNAYQFLGYIVLLREMIVANRIVAPVYVNIYRSLRPKDILSYQTDRQRETEQFAVLLKILYVRVDTKEGNRMCPERPDTVPSFHVLTELY